MMRKPIVLGDFGGNGCDSGNVRSVIDGEESGGLWIGRRENGAIAGMRLFSGGVTGG